MLFLGVDDLDVVLGVDDLDVISIILRGRFSFGGFGGCQGVIHKLQLFWGCNNLGQLDV